MRRGGGICAVPGCGASLARPRRHLLCRAHWRLLPHRWRAELRAAISGWRRAGDTIARRDALIRLRQAQAAAIASWAAAPRARALVVSHILLASVLWPLRRLHGWCEGLWLHALMRAWALALAEGQLGEHHPVAAPAWTALSDAIHAAMRALGAPLARLEARLIRLGARIDDIVRETT